MKLLGRIAMVVCWSALVGCGGEMTEDVGGTASQTAEINPATCPKLSPPGPGFCEDGTIVPVYEGSCLVSYTCDRSTTAAVICPKPVYPGPGFCENGTISPVYSGSCIVGYTCNL